MHSKSRSRCRRVRPCSSAVAATSQAESVLERVYEVRGIDLADQLSREAKDLDETV